MWGRVGGLTRVARVGGDELTRPAREGFAARFDREVDPNGVLVPDERARRAAAARRAYMARLAARRWAGQDKGSRRALRTPAAGPDTAGGRDTPERRAP